MSVKKIIEKFNSKKIAVIGDVMVDEYIYGRVDRISPEAPVPVVKVTKVDCKPGGAANVSANIKSLGADVLLIGQIGEDIAGDNLKFQLDQNGIDHNLVISDMPTIKKTRIVSDQQQMLRFDEEEECSPNLDTVAQIVGELKKYSPDLIILSDYNKGFLSKTLISQILELNIPCIADPKPNNLNLYKGVLAITPNLGEAKSASGKETIEDMAKVLKEVAKLVIITRSEDGLSLFEDDKPEQYVPAQAQEVYDVQGAGDTFIATLALSLACGASAIDSVVLANEAAAISVGKFGTISVTDVELREHSKKREDKVHTIDEMSSLIDNLKSQNKKVVFTNGCFDVLHSGHTRLLNKAKSFGDVLVLGLNTDESIKRLKGDSRPINSQEDRAEVLSNLTCVDYIVFFSQDTPVELISQLKPDVHVKGGDYDPNNYEQMPEAKVVHDYGGVVEIIALVEGKSSTRVINKLK